MTIRKTVTCEKCGDFLCDFVFTDDGEDKAIALFTACPECHSNMTVEFDSVSGDFIDVKRIQ